LLQSGTAADLTRSGISSPIARHVLRGKAFRAAIGPCKAQIASDRYYAVHVLGDLRDARAVQILIPLLKDKEVNYIVPWSLSKIGGDEAAQALMSTLSDKSPSTRVLAIYGLGQMHAVEALPRLRQMMNDNEHCNFEDFISVGDAARGTITELESNPDAIDRLAASFSESDGTWDNGVTPFSIPLPPSATLGSVIAQIFEETQFDSGRRVTDYQILKSRNVVVLHPVGEYTIVLVKTDLGKKIVMTQYTKNGWWYRVYNTGD
jgi:HEAT repeats